MDDVERTLVNLMKSSNGFYFLSRINACLDYLILFSNRSIK